MIRPRLIHITALTLSAGFFLLAGSGCSTATLDRAVVNGRLLPLGQETTDVSIVRKGVSSPAAPGMALSVGDYVQTNGRSKALLSVGKNEVIVYPNSKVGIGCIWMSWGRVLAKIQGRFSVDSERGSASVEGTEFLIEQRRGGKMEVSVLDGSVRLESRGKRRSVTVGEHEEGVIPTDGSPTKRTMSNAEIDCLLQEANCYKQQLYGRMPR